MMVVGAEERRKEIGQCYNNSDDDNGALSVA
jgi:hypothetical protein